MSYTARKLITNAYYLSGIVARELQTVSGQQLEDGMDLLNALLAVKTAHQELIPYYEEYSFNAVASQEKYFVPNLIAVESFTFNIGPVRFSMRPMGREQYFGSSRVDNIGSLPYNWHVERAYGGANVYLYFVPNTNYPLKIWGKFGLDSVANENVDLSTVYDAFYIEYLRYALAEYICAEYNITFQPQSQKKLDELEQILLNISPQDLSLRSMSTLGDDHNRADIYADASIGKGWRT